MRTSGAGNSCVLHANPTSEKLKQEFAEMYDENTDATAADFFQRHFRRPDAAADAKPFPIHVALFYIFVCTCVAAIILLVLLMLR